MPSFLETLQVLGNAFLLYMVVIFVLVMITVIISGLSNIEMFNLLVFCLLPVWLLAMLGLWATTLPVKLVVKGGWGWPFGAEIGRLEGDFVDFTDTF